MADNNNRQKCESLREWAQRRLISGLPCFALSEAEAALRHLPHESLLVALSRLRKAGIVISPFKGFYVSVPDRYRLRGEVPPSFYIDDLMRYLGTEYYLGLTSAASLWGAGHQRVARDFSVVRSTRSLRRLIADGGLELIGRKQSANDWTRVSVSHVVTRNVDGGVARFSDALMTAFDLIQYADLVGGLSSVATILAELLDEVDFSALADLKDIYPSAVWQRLGYVCEEILGRHDRAETLWGIWKSQGFRVINVPLSPFETSKDGPRNRRWHVDINIQLEIDDI